MTTVTYVSHDAPKFSMRITTDKGDFKLQFMDKHCELNLDDPVEKQVSEILDDLISKRPDISSQITKVDREAALKVVAAHKAAQPPSSHTGATTSMHNPAFASQLDQRGRELRSQGVSEEDVQHQLNQMKTELQLTSPSAEIVRDSSGFIPNPEPPKPVDIERPEPIVETGDNASKPASAKKVFSLGKKSE